MKLWGPSIFITPQGKMMWGNHHCTGGSITPLALVSLLHQPNVYRRSTNTSFTVNQSGVGSQVREPCACKENCSPHYTHSANRVRPIWQTTWDPCQMKVQLLLCVFMQHCFLRFLFFRQWGFKRLQWSNKEVQCSQSQCWRNVPLNTKRSLHTDTHGTLQAPNLSPDSAAQQDTSRSFGD